MDSKQIEVGKWYKILAHWGEPTRIVKITGHTEHAWWADTPDGRHTRVWYHDAEWMVPAEEGECDAPLLRPRVLRTQYDVERHFNEDGDDGSVILSPAMRELYGEI